MSSSSFAPLCHSLDHSSSFKDFALGVAHVGLGDPAAARACWRETEKYYRLMGMVEDADSMLQWIARAEGESGA
jgi:hypothetical protein